MMEETVEQRLNRLETSMSLLAEALAHTNDAIISLIAELEEAEENG